MKLNKRIQYLASFKGDKINCDRCHKSSYCYYTLSYLTKGLWIACLKCGLHAVPYISGLKIPSIPSKHFLKHTPNLEATG